MKRQPPTFLIPVTREEFLKLPMPIRLRALKEQADRLTAGHKPDCICYLCHP